jgi:putative cardiolipin synthase
LRMMLLRRRKASPIFPDFYRMILRLTQAILLALLSACTSVPFDYPKTASTAILPDSDTRLGAIGANWQREHGSLSGILGLSDGVDALGARLGLMEAAQRSVDAQYFIVKNDRAGALFVGKMLLAADRGVRVRLLVDDIFSPGVDDPLSLLNVHSNVEVRLFNPLSRQSFKYWSYLVDFERANRRMHNKSFTADNTVTIVGGRNIGEEYFELDQDIKFDDLEVLAVGPVVGQVSEAFDKYWNSELAVPIEAFGIKSDPGKLDRWRNDIRAEVDRGTDGIYGKAIDSSLMQAIREQTVRPIVASATMVSDNPEKLLNPVGEAGQAILAQEKATRFRAAQREVVIITPYFIPLDGGSRLLEELLARGVRVVIVTNSLASTNHVPVYASYVRYRKRLLLAGAEFYEIRADNQGEANAVGNRPEMVTLHTKATLIDRESVFVGSLNFDPRSVLINTEMGLFIDSDQIAGRLSDVVFEELPGATYKVELDEKGNVRWRYSPAGDPGEVFHSAPQTSWGRRFLAGFYRLLPLENQL